RRRHTCPSSYDLLVTRLLGRRSRQTTIEQDQRQKEEQGLSCRGERLAKRHPHDGLPERQQDQCVRKHQDDALRVPPVRHSAEAPKTKSSQTGQEYRRHGTEVPYQLAYEARGDPRLAQPVERFTNDWPR